MVLEYNMYLTAEIDEQAVGAAWLPWQPTSIHPPWDCMWRTMQGSGLDRASRSEIPLQVSRSSTLVRWGLLNKPRESAADS